MANSVPEGLTLEFDNDVTTDNMVALTLKADSEMPAGKYTILLQGKSTRVTKGITFTISVTEKRITKN
jgi:uncharacterized membrane protein